VLDPSRDAGIVHGFPFGPFSRAICRADDQVMKKIQAADSTGSGRSPQKPTSGSTQGRQIRRPIMRNSGPKRKHDWERRKRKVRPQEAKRPETE